VRDAVCGRSLIGIYDLHSTNLLVSRRDLDVWLGLPNVNLGPNSCAILLAEILKTLFKSVHPAAPITHAVTVCYCCYCCSAASKQKIAKKRVKPENTRVTRKYPGFPRVFSGITHCTLEIVVGHCQGRPSLLLSFNRPNVSYCCWGAPLLFCCYC